MCQDIVIQFQCLETGWLHPKQSSHTFINSMFTAPTIVLSEMNTTYIYVGVITPLIGSLLIESITPLPTDVVNAFFKAQMP